MTLTDLSSAEWHDYWKGMVDVTQREQPRGAHIADVVAANGCVVEVQHASMSPTRITGRELDHGHMIWMWDGRAFYRTGKLEITSFETGTVTFRWKNHRRNLRSCRRPVFLDLWTLGQSNVRVVLRIELLREDGSGVGHLITHHAMRLWMACGIPYKPLAELPEGAQVPTLVSAGA